jgi:hypothetical protein
MRCFAREEGGRVNDNRLASSFEVGVAVVAIDDGMAQGNHDGVLTGYEEASGFRVHRRDAAVRQGVIVIKGACAVHAATEAIAGQIALTTERIAAAIRASSVAQPLPGGLGLGSVQVSFGITLAAGVQALFTAQAESSVQVSITLIQQPEAAASSDEHHD